MKIFAISDLHISTSTNKPMDIFGGNWVNYMEKICEDWENKVSDDDLVLIGGDISWAMALDDAKKDLEIISKLKGKKILIKGNHDYWWSGIGKVRDMLPENFYALQNDSVRFDGVVICGSRCWSVPGSPDFDEQDRKIYNREIERLRLSLKNAERFLVKTSCKTFNAERISPFVLCAIVFNKPSSIVMFLLEYSCFTISITVVNLFSTSADVTG